MKIFQNSIYYIASGFVGFLIGGSVILWLLWDSTQNSKDAFSIFIQIANAAGAVATALAAVLALSQWRRQIHYQAGIEKTEEILRAARSLVFMYTFLRAKHGYDKSGYNLIIGSEEWHSEIKKYRAIWGESKYLLNQAEIDNCIAEPRRLLESIYDADSKVLCSGSSGFDLEHKNLSVWFNLKLGEELAEILKKLDKDVPKVFMK